MTKTRVLSYDPGLTIYGWALGDHNDQDNTLDIVAYGTVQPSGHLHLVKHREEVQLWGRRILALSTLRDTAIELYNTYKPEFICAEGAFYNPARPNAYAALLQCLCALDFSMRDACAKRVYKMQPKTIKKTVDKGNAYKKDVLNAIRNIQGLTFKDGELPDHVSDAIAINWTFCQLILPSIRKDGYFVSETC